MINIPGTNVHIVDDDPEKATSLLALLARNRYHAHRFNSPSEAPPLGNPERPGLLWSEVFIPEVAMVNEALRMACQFPDRTILLWLDRPEREA